MNTLSVPVSRSNRSTVLIRLFIVSYGILFPLSSRLVLVLVLPLTPTDTATPNWIRCTTLSVPVSYAVRVLLS